MLTHKTLIEPLHAVSLKGRFVSIDKKALEKFTDDFSPKHPPHWSFLYPLGYKRRKKVEDELDFLFLIGSQAFCFWGFPEKWTVNYKGKLLDGWWALIASFEKALDKGMPILDGGYLSQLSLTDAKKIFKGYPEIQLLKKRRLILKKVGSTLKSKYGGRFHRFFKTFEKDAVCLLDKIASEFYGFDDIYEYKSTTVYFYKKAQVVVWDINQFMQSQKMGEIAGVDNLTGHADYKIPAVLRKLGILKYNKELSKEVDTRSEIKEGSEQEIEIRANTLWVLYLISERLKSEQQKINPLALSGILWNISQTKNRKDKPYHLTKTIYY